MVRITKPLKCTSVGFTLIELLIVIIIAAIVIALAIPTYTVIRQQQEATQLFHKIKAILMYARSTSLTTPQNITLCGSRTGTACDGTWDKGVIMFNDNHKAGIIDVGDTIRSFEPIALKYGTLKYNGALSSHHVRYFGLIGLPVGNNGSFFYCPLNNDMKKARAIILSDMGNARPSQDKNKDGIHEDSEGKNITCT